LQRERAAGVFGSSAGERRLFLRAAAILRRFGSGCWQLGNRGDTVERCKHLREPYSLFGPKPSIAGTPMTFIKQTRLRLARQKLCNPGRKMTVASVASQCGFKNHSHFSGDYRNEFGELPSETLKRYR
jgi:AraC-like DNA-binding protein